MVRISIIIKYINIDFPVDVCGFIFSDHFCAISSLFITHLLFYAGHVCAEYSQGGRRIQRNGNENAKTVRLFTHLMKVLNVSLCL